MDKIEPTTDLSQIVIIKTDMGYKITAFTKDRTLGSFTCTEKKLALELVAKDMESLVVSTNAQ